MELRNKSFPYPVLSDHTSDYKESSFITKVNYQREGTDLLFHLEYQLINGELKKLIEEEFLNVIFHIECPQTTYRKAFTMKGQTLEVPINESLINGKIEINSFLVTNKVLNDY